MTTDIYQSILKAKTNKVKQIALLVDPDKSDEMYINKLIAFALESKVDYLFVGGSLLTEGKFEECIETLKSQTKIPVVIFPGNNLQIHPFADAILFLSLISGRNPDLLIGQQVKAAPLIKQYGLEYIPTGYMLIDGGNITSVQYMSNTTPIPANKPDIAVATALAGQMLGLKCIYMDAGSGANNHISEHMISKVSEQVDLPIIVGGGIRTAADAQKIAKAGADIIVVGNAIEKNAELILEMSLAIKDLVLKP